MKYSRKQFIEKLIEHEGCVLTVYQDSLGIDTIGIGRNLQDRGISPEELAQMETSIEDIHDKGITEADAIYLAENDVQIVEDELSKAHPCVERLDAVRQLILMDMAYNMGVPRLRKFKNMWRNIHKGVEADIKKEKFFRAASLEMLDSKWARQVKSRAKKMAIAMRSGEF